ncbi:MAG: fibronectin type III-like domain-contianing protein [Bellilinea sp.]
MSYRNAAFPVAERVADLLTRMTIDEKIGQLFQTFITDENYEEVKQQIRATGLDSRILAASNLAGNMMLRMAELDDLTEIQRVAGEIRRVEFELGPDELSYYGPGGKWMLEPGEFKVWIGNDSRAELEGSFTVTL